MEHVRQYNKRGSHVNFVQHILQHWNPGVYALNVHGSVDTLNSCLEQCGYQIFRLDGRKIKGLGDFRQQAIQILGFPVNTGYTRDAIADRITDMPWIPSPSKKDVILWDYADHSYDSDPSDFWYLVMVMQSYIEELCIDDNYQLYTLLVGDFPIPIRGLRFIDVEL